MLEKRWLLRLGPPVVLVVASAALAGDHAQTLARSATSASIVRAQPAPEPDRIPPDVARRAWLAERGDGMWLYGPAGAAERRALPREETGLAIGDRLVASTQPLDSSVSRVRLRDWRSGKLVATVDAALWVSAAAFRGDDLIVTGYGDGRARSDGGIVLIPRNGKPEMLVPGGSFPAALGGAAARGSLFVSPNGRLAASYLCTDERCDTEVVDLASRAVFRPTRAAPGFLRALTDTDVILTDDDYAWIVAADAQTGRERWRIPDSILMTPLAGADGTIVGLTGSADRGWAVATIDATGKETDVTRRSRNGSFPQVWTQLSTPTTAVVGRSDFAAALSIPTGAVADLLDVTHRTIIGRQVPVLAGSR